MHAEDKKNVPIDNLLVTFKRRKMTKQQKDNDGLRKHKSFIAIGL